MKGTAARFSGRLVGFLLAWLFAGHDYYDRAGHQLLNRREKAGDDQIALVERQACRIWAAANIAEVLSKERPKEDGEPEEPIEVCY